MCYRPDHPELDDPTLLEATAPDMASGDAALGCAWIVLVAAAVIVVAVLL